MAILVGGTFFVMGIKFSILPSFYPKEAEARGATPSQVTTSKKLLPVVIVPRLINFN